MLRRLHMNAQDLPLVSVVTPSWNQAAFIEETIRSVIDQDYPRIEYIVIDGGSKDDSVSIIRKYADRLAYWTSEPDDGQASAINKGWARATGDIVAFLNSDDCYLPGAVSKIVGAFRSHPEAGVAYGQARWVTVDGRSLRSTNMYVDGQAFLDRLYEGLPQPATFVRRAVIERVGVLDSSFHMALDGEFFLRAVGNFPAVAMPDVLATMRLHGESKSVALGQRFIPDIFRLADKIVNHPEAYPRYRITAADVRAAAHIAAARYKNVAGDHGAALTHIWSSARLSPKYRARLLLRELPRIAAHATLGSAGYARFGQFVSSFRHG